MAQVLHLMHVMPLPCRVACDNTIVMMRSCPRPPPRTHGPQLCLGLPLNEAAPHTTTVKGSRVRSNDLPITTKPVSRRFCCFLCCSCAARRPFLGLRRCHPTASQLGHRPILRSARCTPSASFGAPRWRLTLSRPPGFLRCLPPCPAFASACRCCCARVAPGGSSASHSALCCSRRQRLQLAAIRAPVFYGRSSGSCSSPWDAGAMSRAAQSQSSDEAREKGGTAAASSRPLHSAT